MYLAPKHTYLPLWVVPNTITQLDPPLSRFHLKENGLGVEVPVLLFYGQVAELCGFGRTPEAALFLMAFMATCLGEVYGFICTR